MVLTVNDMKTLSNALTVWYPSDTTVMRLKARIDKELAAGGDAGGDAIVIPEVTEQSLSLWYDKEGEYLSTAHEKWADALNDLRDEPHWAYDTVKNSVAALAVELFPDSDLRSAMIAERNS